VSDVRGRAVSSSGQPARATPGNSARLQLFLEQREINERRRIVSRRVEGCQSMENEQLELQRRFVM
jgi:hypothetical protein